MSKMDAKDIIYLAAILATTGLGRAKLPELVQAMGSAQAVFEAEREQLLATGLVSDDAVKQAAQGFAPKAGALLRAAWRAPC